MEGERAARVGAAILRKVKVRGLECGRGIMVKVFPLKRPLIRCQGTKMVQYFRESPIRSEDPNRQNKILAVKNMKKVPIRFNGLRKPEGPKDSASDEGGEGTAELIFDHIGERQCNHGSGIVGGLRAKTMLKERVVNKFPLSKGDK